MILATVLTMMTATNSASLYNACKEYLADPKTASDYAVGFCSGYMQGNQFGYNLGKASGARYCPPPEFTPIQAMAIYVKFVSNNPEQMHEDEQRLLATALSLAFPCPPQE